MLLPIPRFVQYYEYKFKQSKTQSSFSAFLPCSHLARVVFRNEVSSPDAICFAPKGRGSFPGFKKKSFKLSRLPSFFAKERSIQLTLTVRSSLLVVKGCVHVVLWLSETGYWCPDSVVRHPALLSLTAHSALFSRKIVGIKHMSLHTIILVSESSLGTSTPWPALLGTLRLIQRPVMVSARSQGKSRGLCVTVKSLYFSLSSFPHPFGSSLGCTKLS